MAAPSQQELIVRQSQLQRSIEMFQLMGIQPSVREVCRLSQILTNFIFDWDEKSDDIKNFERAMGIKHHSAIVGKDLVEALKKKDNLKQELIETINK